MNNVEKDILLSTLVERFYSRPYTFKTKLGVFKCKSQNLLKYASNIQLG